MINFGLIGCLIDFLKKLFPKKSGGITHNVSLINFHGNYSPNNTFITVEGKEAARELVDYAMFLLKNHSIIDFNKDKFNYYVNQSLLILKLNDSQTKCHVLKELLYRKLSGDDLKVDDSDSALTIALESMKYLTDKTLQRFCSYRILINVIPSLMSLGKLDEDSPVIKYIEQNGCLTNDDINNLRIRGLIYDMTTSIYSFKEVQYTQNVMRMLSELKCFNDSLMLSNALTPVG